MQTIHVQKNETVQKIANNGAVAILDNSLQNSSLQRKADLTNGVVQRVFAGPLTSNADVERQDSEMFDLERARFREADRFPYEIKYANRERRRLVLRIGEDIENAGTYKNMVKAWIKQLKKMSVVIPDGLEIFVSNVFTYQCSFNFGSGKICLKPASIANLLNAGPSLGLNEYNLVANQVSGGDVVKFGSVTMMHELGHILHEKSSPDFFRQKTARAIHDDQTYNTVRQISDYAATKTQAEFVAETFAGLANGLLYSEDVASLYWKLSGPRCGELYEKSPGRYGFRKNTRD